MKQRLLIAFLTVLVFGAGFGARMLTEDESVVPPPAVPGSEFVRGTGAASGANGKTDARPAGLTEKDRAKFLADIDKTRPQIDAYHKRMDEIAEEFDRDFVQLLNPEQRAIFDAQKKKSAESRAKREAREAAETGPLSDQQIEHLRRQPLWNAVWAIAVTWKLERYTHDFKLDPAQQSKVRSLLETRREKFLALVDSTQPPSITYSDLARRAQLLLTPEPKPDAVQAPAK